MKNSRKKFKPDFLLTEKQFIEKYDMANPQADIEQWRTYLKYRYRWMHTKGIESEKNRRLATEAYNNSMK